MGYILRLGVAALLLISTCAAAAEWRALGTSGKVKVEMDVASVKRVGTVAEAWDRESYAKPEQARPGDFYFSSVKTLSRYGCDQRLTEMLAQVYYAEDGTEIKRIAGAGEDSWPGHVVPDSVGEWKYNYACGKSVGATQAAPKAKKKAAAKPRTKLASKNGTSKTGAVPCDCPDQAGAGKPAVPAKPVGGVKAAPAKAAPLPVRSPEPVTTLDSMTKKAPPAKKL